MHITKLLSSNYSTNIDNSLERLKLLKCLAQSSRPIMKPGSALRLLSLRSDVRKRSCAVLPDDPDKLCGRCGLPRMWCRCRTVLSRKAIEPNELWSTSSEPKASTPIECH